MVQKQAIRDFAQAMRNFFAGTHRSPTWRKAGVHEGFLNEGDWSVRRVSQHVGEVVVPKTGWVRFRWSRKVPAAKSYRVTLDRAARWHIAFAAIPAPIAGPGTGDVVGIDRGVAETGTLPGDPRQLREQVPVGRLGRPAEVEDLAVAILRHPYLRNITAGY